MEGGREERHHHFMRITHPYIFQRDGAWRRKTGLRCEGKGKISQPYEWSSLTIDVSLYGGIPPRMPLDRKLVREISPFDLPLLDFGEVKSLEGDFGMGDVKVIGKSMRRASHARSLALSLGRIDPYWRSQLLVEYSKDLGACMILDDPDRDDRYLVDDMVIYS